MTAHRAAQGSRRRARLLFVHAHPDDETLLTGITMAAYAAQGHDVHLLTCTLGEEGEVIPAEQAHLRSDRDDSLGYTRREELRAAMAVLGVQHAVLGEDPARGVASRYRDSGMVGTSGAQHPDAFAAADLDEAAAMVAAHIKALRPDVVVTYDKQGGYSHPDHVQAHRVTMSALSALSARTASAELDATAVPVAYCILTPQSWASQDRVWLQENVPSTSSTCVVLQQDDPYPPSVVRDEVVTHVVDEPALVETQSRALAQHKTQVVVYDGYYTLSNHVAARLSGREGFARFDLATGDLVPAAHGAPWHAGLLTDLEGRR
ncbi:MAG TPA: N-acetyl-1-D-myo-inositol-2-amino-2-deoxy-alpha-D-glucopyranoside deacetylase [Dermatophilaceae bacterium]|nr:N-acetyl-1-D-myo-inositol-2-amino-2-deoxy-alpha-D-glucopyranoside deacetylase [Dermatophilaceae bacterium]